MQCPIICIHKQVCLNLMKLGIYSPYDPFSANGVFLSRAFTSGVRAPPDAEASFYSLQGKLLCNFAHYYLPFISKVHYK